MISVVIFNVGKEMGVRYLADGCRVLGDVEEAVRQKWSGPRRTPRRSDLLGTTFRHPITRWCRIISKLGFL